MKAASTPEGRAAPAVVIVAAADDVHALAVRRRLREIGAGRLAAVILDTRTFPLASDVTWACGPGGALEGRLTAGAALPGGVNRASDPRRLDRPKLLLSTRDIVSIWLRRPREVGRHDAIAVPEFAEYASVATSACLGALFSVCRTHNAPAAERRLKSKPFQLHEAARTGFRIPRTLVTARPDEVRSFVGDLAREGRSVVYKQVVTTPDGPPTRSFTRDDEARLAALELCPTTFQERIAGGPDLRIAVVGDRVFAAEWRRADGVRDSVDVRLDREARLFPVEPAAGFRRRLVALHRTLGLSLGVYDFKVDGAGVPYFLEVNPAGQWLSLEVEAGHPVSECLARMLAGARGGAPSPGPFTTAALADLASDAELEPAGVARA